MTNRETKKTETLELRIAYDVKQELVDRANHEKRSVSEVVRGLINSYLALPVTQQRTLTPSSVKRALVFQYLKKPKALFASLLMIATPSLLFFPVASADDYVLNMEGEIRQMFKGPDSDHLGQRVRRFTTQIASDYGAPLAIGLNGQGLGVGQDVSATHLNKDAGKQIVIQVTKVDDVKGEGAVAISLKIIDFSGGVERIIAQPQLVTTDGQTAQFVFEREGQTYDFTFVPEINP